jgi:hypothetical protein
VVQQHVLALHQISFHFQLAELYFYPPVCVIAAVQNPVTLKYYIKENSLLARLAARKLKQDKMAMVLGKTILLHDTTRQEFINNRKWIRHELAHIQQFKKHGYFLFLIKYLVESIRNGYHNNKYEKEARLAEEDESLDRFIPPFKVS